MSVISKDDAEEPKMIRSTESHSTSIAAGGYVYDREADGADFETHTASELRELETEHGFDFAAHPAMSTTTPTALADQLAAQYGIDRAAALTAVNTYAGQLQDDDLYDTETGTLSEAGAQCIREQFAADYDGEPIPGTVAADHQELRTEIRTVTAQLDELPARRDALIRQAIAAGVRVAHIADDSGLKPARIYQIRDGRR